MKISEYIEKLNELKDEWGDLDVAKQEYYLCEDNSHISRDVDHYFVELDKRVGKYNNHERITKYLYDPKQIDENNKPILLII